jgi:hypothetical protein
MQQTISVPSPIQQPASPLDPLSYEAPARPRRGQPTARRQPVRSATLLACLDGLAAVVAICLVLVFVNLSTLSGGLESFLSARITVKNLLLLIFLVTAWPIVFWLCGLYDAGRVRRRRSEAARLLAAVTVGTVLASIVPLTSTSRSFTLNDLQHFWWVSLSLGLLVRTCG